MAEHVGQEEIKHKLAEQDCPYCGHELHSCGSKDTEHIKIITAPKPKQPFSGSIASPEALTAVVNAIYCAAQPLYRQAGIYKRGG